MKVKQRILCGVAALAMAGQVSAAVDWVLTTGSVTPAGQTVSATSSGWADTGSAGGAGGSLAAQLAPSNFVLYGGGLGINNLDGCSSGATCDVGDLASTAPEHALDNEQRSEMVLLSFSSNVKLTNAKFGWVGTDSDYTVMAYTGTGAPTLAGKTSWGALGTGWSSIGNYSDAAVNVNNSINSGNVFSSYWLIGAYNPLANPGGGSVTGAAYNTAGSYDFLKLASVTGCVSGSAGCTSGGANPAAVPEPGSLSLLGLSLLGMVSLRKRRQA